MKAWITKEIAQPIEVRAEVSMPGSIRFWDERHGYWSTAHEFGHDWHKTEEDAWMSIKARIDGALLDMDKQRDRLEKLDDEAIVRISELRGRKKR